MIAFTTALAWVWFLGLVTAAPNEPESAGDPATAAQEMKADADSVALTLPAIDLDGGDVPGGTIADTLIPPIA